MRGLCSLCSAALLCALEGFLLVKGSPQLPGLQGSIARAACVLVRQPPLGLQLWQQPKIPRGALIVANEPKQHTGHTLKSLPCPAMLSPSPPPPPGCHSKPIPRQGASSGEVLWIYCILGQVRSTRKGTIQCNLPRQKLFNMHMHTHTSCIDLSLHWHRFSCDVACSTSRCT